MTYVQRAPRYLLQTALLFLVAPLPAQAIPVQVDWTASVTGAVGSGTLSGSLGVFDVTAAGQAFGLPTDGSLTATASGFDSLQFPNGVTTFVAGVVSFRFDTVAPYSGQLVGSDFLRGSLGCAPDVCTVILDGRDNTAGALRVAGISQLLSSATPTFSFTVIPEPGTAFLLGIALVGLGARRLRAYGNAPGS